MAEKEFAGIDFGLELFPAVTFLHMSIPECKCLGVDIVLNIIKQTYDMFRYSVQRHGLFGKSIAPCHFYSPGYKIPCAHCYTYRHALQLPFCKFESRIGASLGGSTSPLSSP